MNKNLNGIGIQKLRFHVDESLLKIDLHLMLTYLVRLDKKSIRTDIFRSKLILVRFVDSPCYN